MKTIRCPHCGEETPQTREDASLSNGEHSEYICLNCGKPFGQANPTAPDSALNQCDTFYFSYGGYFGGYKSLKMQEKDGYAELTIEPPYSEFEHSGLTFRTTLDEWRDFKQTLFHELFILSWTEDYTDPDILDGTQWEIRLEFDTLKSVNISGSNRYPVYYDDLIEHTAHYFSLIDEME
ncbi:MAG: hypothetical protein JJU01_08590 [Alkalibacterium sp.]|nr:hypothetical protein [Alkalibacterium sp.]